MEHADIQGAGDERALGDDGRPMAQNLPLNRSIWASTAKAGPETRPLQGDVTAEVAVIGGGFSGLSTALHLAERGTDVRLLEADEVGWGGSGRNAGLVNAGLFVDPSVIVGHYGERHGPGFARLLGNAPLLVRELIERHRIDCDAGDRGIVKAAHSNAALRTVQETVRQWQDLGEPVELLSAADVARRTGSSFYKGGLIDHRSFTIEPLAYARGLADAAVEAGAKLHARSRARRIEAVAGGVRIETDQGTLAAKRAVIATGAYDQALLPSLTRAFVPVGYFLVATEPLSHNMRAQVLPEKQAVYDTQPSLLSVRYNREHRLVVGNLGWLPPERSGRTWAGHVLRELFPMLGDIRFTHGWSGVLDMTDDHMPWLAEPMPNVLMVGGFNGRGIGPGTAWGKVLADWAASGDASSLPIRPQAVPNIRSRWIKGHAYQAAFKGYRLRMRLRRPRRAKEPA
ncbi:MAG: FAD-binding oxidoreductase [Hyphomicrobiaceae bacterium]